MKVLLWLLHPDPNSRATLNNLQEDKWVNQKFDVNQYSFEAVISGKLTEFVSCISRNPIGYTIETWLLSVAKPSCILSLDAKSRT